MADKEFTLTTSSCFNPDYEPIIDSIEVYGLKKEKFDWVTKISQLEALINEKNEIISKNPIENITKKIIEILILFYSNSSIPRNNKIDEQLIKYLIINLNDYTTYSSIYDLIKNLLFILQKNQSSYIFIKDHTQLVNIIENLEANVDPIIYSRDIKIIHKIATHRPVNFGKIIFQYPSLLNILFKNFNNIYFSKTNFPNLKDSIEKFVEIIYHFMLHMTFHDNEQMKDDMKLSSLQLIQELLFFPNETVRNVVSKKLSNLLIKFLKMESTNLVKDDTFDTIQYFCDKCHIGPIINKRWSCNECKNFDLCENCYLYEKDFPSPHLITHSMTEHKIEMTQESSNIEIEGIKSLIPNGVEPDDEETLLTLAIEMSLEEENAPPPSNVIVSPSTSRDNKLKLQKILIQFLLNDFTNIQKHGGLICLPYFQLLYNLVESIIGDNIFEKKIVDDLTKIFLKEDLFNNSAILDNKTEKLETQILLLMCVALLLNPKKEENYMKWNNFIFELSNQLRNQGVIHSSFVLLNHCLKLIKERKKLEVSVATNGALLSPIDETNSENFDPFFSEKYVKENLQDLFGNYIRLVMESLFSILLVLIKTEKKLIDKMGDENEGIKLFIDEEWIPLLCSFINYDSISFIHSNAKKLLLAVCQSKLKYHHVRDYNLFESNFQSFQQLENKSKMFTEDLLYNENISLIEILSTVMNCASTRPYNWQSFSINNEKILLCLFQYIFCFNEEACALILKLLSLIFTTLEDSLKIREDLDKKRKIKKKKTKKKVLSEPSNSTIINKKETKKLKEKKEFITYVKSLTEKLPEKINLFLKNDNFSSFIDIFLMQFNNCEIRTETQNFLYGLWIYSQPEQKQFLFNTLASKLSFAPSCGCKASEYMETISWIISKIEIDLKDNHNNQLFKNILEKFAYDLLETLKKQNSLLFNHPNSQIYKVLSSILELGGYYLESEPCLVCNDPEQPWFQLNLRHLKNDTKYTDSSHIIKFSNSYIIQNINLHIFDIKRAKMVKTINFYCNNKLVSDLSELRNKWNMWKKIKSVELTPGQTEIYIEFPIPVVATNFLIEYASFYENLQALATEKLQCPRCNRVVTDKHGLCSRCRENAYQCRQCRNINYENLDAFLCNECGYCKWARFDFSLKVKRRYYFKKIFIYNEYF